jgi:hypothetical protein
MEQNRPAEGMANEDCAVMKEFALLDQRSLPRGVARVIFIGHPRVVDAVASTELALEIFDEFVVPLIMGTFAGALNEEKLRSHENLALP